MLELQDDMSPGVIRAAAAFALLDKQIGHLSGQAVESSKATRSASRDIDGMTRSADLSSGSINQLTGRLGLLARGAAALGPAFVPIGAIAVPAIAGLTSELGFAVLGAGTAVLAFQGIGDTLKAVSKADLEPTTKNLEAAREAMDRLSPAARAFVRELRTLSPVLTQLRDTAAAGLFPGLIEGIDGLQGALPRVEKIISSISTTLGGIAADAGQSLGSGRWAPFLDFIAEEAPAALADLATSIGNVTHSMANLWMAFTPVNDGFSAWLVRVTGELDNWSAGLAETQGFQDFIDYINENGPQVADTFGAIGNALLQIVQASAPLGGPVLKIVESLADALAGIADSDLGTPIFGLVAAMSALSLVTRGYGAIVKSGPIASTRMLTADLRTMGTSGLFAYSGLSRGANQYAAAQARVGAQLKNFGKSTALLGGLALASSGAADKIGLTNTATLGLMGAMSGGWPGVIGAGVGLVLDLGAANSRAAEAAEGFTATLDRQTGALTENSREWAASQISTGDLSALQDAGVDVSALTDALLNGSQAFEVFRDSVGIEGRGKGKLFRNDAEDAIANLQELAFKVDDGRERFNLLAPVIDKVTTAQNAQSNASIRQQSAMRMAGETAKTISASWRTLGADIDNAKVSLDQWIQSQADQARAMQDAGKNAQTALDRGLRPTKVQELLDAGPAGALRLKELAEGTTAQIRALNKAQGSFIRGQKDIDEAVAQTAAKLQGLTYRPYMLRIDANTSPAQAALAQLRADVARMRLTVKVTASTNATVADAVVSKADGGTIPGPRYPYADKILMLGAPGEEVITNRHGQADRFRADRASGRIPAYASGGTVGNRPALNDYIRNDLDMKLPSTLKQWNKALAASTKVVEKETAKRQALLDQAQQIRDSISSNYKSDLFGQSDSSVWMSAADRMKSGKGDVFSTLTGDISNLNSLKGAIGQLRTKGLDGPALANLLSEGSLQDVQGFASGPKSEVARLESLFNQRDRLSAEVGNVGASAAFGPQLAASKAQLATLNRLDRAMTRVGNLLEKNPNATGVAVARAINGVGPKRPRKGDR